MTWIGARTPRLRDNLLLTGRAQFVDDVRVANALQVAFVRSSHAHAHIRGIETSRARQVQGVYAVLTLDELAAATLTRRMPLIAASAPAKTPSTPFILADKEVCYVGEPVAIVVADSRHVAEDAAALIEIDYDRLPCVADVRDGVKAGAPLVRTELGSNVLNTFTVEYGDVGAAFGAGARVFREEIWQHRGCGHPIEARGIVVENRGDSGGLLIWSSTQMPNALFQAVTETIEIDESKLRVISPDVGGGFGPKYCVYPDELAVVCAARLLGRSLKWTEDRREHFLAAIQERDQYWSVEVAVDDEGRLRGVRGQMVHDQGAYTIKAANLPYNSATAVPGPYLLPAYRMDVTVALTNKVPASSVRGAGYPEAAFVMERLLDRAARELGMDNAEIRRRNLIPKKKMPYRKPLKARSGAEIIYDSGDYLACQERVLVAAGWDGFPKRQAEARSQGRYIGLGLANAVKGTGRGPFESGIVRIAPSGRVSVFTGAAEIGQGLSTALAQICAEQLGLRPDQVSVVTGDTSAAPLGLGAFASRQLVTAGSSVLLAARNVADKARKAASHMLEASENDLKLAGGRVHVVGAEGHGVTLGEIARLLRGAPGYAFPEGLSPGLEASENWQTGQLAYANASHVAEVEVDIETGHVAVTRYFSIQDSGRLINPMLVDGQVRGGITHGIGNAVLELMRFDEAGQPLTVTFGDYLLPTAPDVPRFETLYQETPSPNNPLGAKGVGEVGTIPAAAAVISAIENALAPFGVKIAQSPITPPELLELIRAAR